MIPANKQAFSPGDGSGLSKKHGATPCQAASFNLLIQNLLQMPFPTSSSSSLCLARNSIKDELRREETTPSVALVIGELGVNFVTAFIPCIFMQSCSPPRPSLILAPNPRGCDQTQMPIKRRGLGPQRHQKLQENSHNFNHNSFKRGRGFRNAVIVGYDPNSVLIKATGGTGITG